MVVNKAVVAATRKNLAIDPDNGRHLTVFIKNVEGEFIKVLTTNVALEATRFSDTNVFYESDKIQSWDNRSGMISLGLDVLPSWQISASYSYEANDYEYTSLNFNPLNNSDILDYLYVIYIIPDVNSADTAVHYLKVDRSGVIVETSQSLGLNHPNLQLKNADGSYNSDTVIGLKYVSDIDTDTFVTRYIAGFNNDYGYALLGEIVVMDVSLPEYQFYVDARRQGARLTAEKFEAAIRANPKLAQSMYGFGEDGIEYPANGVMVIKAPLSLLEDYGGFLQQDEAEKYLRTYMQSYGYAVIDWEYPAVELTAEWSLVAGENVLTWTWEGPYYNYNLYRRDNPTKAWELIYTETTPVEGSINYTDAGLDPNDVYYYSVRVVDSITGIEYPEGYSLGIKVRE